jgi:hypothetical protein
VLITLVKIDTPTALFFGTKMSIPTISPDVLMAHMAEVCEYKDMLSSNSDPKVKKLVKCYLDSLASKAGNDTLEDLLVRATGRETKKVGQKHGADSEDGQVEAKPCKGKYAAHISDDTGMSLRRHQKIPFCILGVATDDGQKIKWAIIVSYRVFDNARYLGIRKRLGLHGEAWPDKLPEDKVSRDALLDNLVKHHKENTGVRSNPLRLACLKSLSKDEYSLWVNPEFRDKVDPVIKKLA